MNVVDLPSDGRNGQWLQHTSLADQALAAVQGKVSPTAGADGHLEGRLGARLGEGSKPRATVSAVGVPWVLRARLLAVHTAVE